MGISRRTFVTSVAVTPLFRRRGGFAMAQTSAPATPDASAAFGEASDRFREMMAIAPTSPPEGYVNLTWVGLERHIAAFPTLDPVEVETSLPAGMNVDAPFRYFDIEQVIGYAFMQIRQQVTLGAGRSLVRIARLDADARALPETWESHGFERQDSNAGPFWTIGEGDEDSGENELHHRFQGTYNSVTVLEDDLIAIAPDPDLLNDVMIALQNQAYALADIVEPLANELYEDTTSVWHTEGSRLILTQRTYWDVHVPDVPDESDAAVGRCPLSIPLRSVSPLAHHLTLNSSSHKRVNPSCSNPQNQTRPSR